MGSSEIYQYSSKQQSFARTAKALGHPARIAIVQHLSEFGLTTNAGLMKLTELADAAATQHLFELSRAGIVEGTFVQNKHYYRLTIEAEKNVENLRLVFDGIS